LTSASGPTRAMIMAAGLGTRLYPLTRTTPKPMVPVVNRPVMEHMLALLVRHGVTEVAANLHYYPDDIRSYFGDGSGFGVRLHFNYEVELLGTAGGVGAFRGLLADGTFLVMSGDGLTGVDLTAFLAAHRSSGGIASLAVKRVADTTQYGVVVADDAGRVTGFQEKPAPAEALSDVANTGIYAFEPAIFDYIPEGEFVDWAKDVFPALLEDDRPFHRWRLDGYWNDVGDLEQYRNGNVDALTGCVDVRIPGAQVSQGVWAGAGTHIHPDAQVTGPVLIGDGCRVEAGARLTGPLIVGDGCVVEHRAILEGVVAWPGVVAGRGARIAAGILANGVTLHHGAVLQQDVVVGAGSEVAADATVPAGSRLEPHTLFAPDGPRPGAAS
jgi:mannose-1-phosphate guanylyltransferase